MIIKIYHWYLVSSKLAQYLKFSWGLIWAQDFTFNAYIVSIEIFEILGWELNIYIKKTGIEIEDEDGDDGC